MIIIGCVFLVLIWFIGVSQTKKSPFVEVDFLGYMTLRVPDDYKILGRVPSVLDLNNTLSLKSFIESQRINNNFEPYERDYQNEFVFTFHGDQKKGFGYSPYLTELRVVWSRLPGQKGDWDQEGVVATYTRGNIHIDLKTTDTQTLAEKDALVETIGASLVANEKNIATYFSAVDSLISREQAQADAQVKALNTVILARGCTSLEMGKITQCGSFLLGLSTNGRSLYVLNLFKIKELPEEYRRLETVRQMQERFGRTLVGTESVNTYSVNDGSDRTIGNDTVFLEPNPRLKVVNESLLNEFASLLQSRVSAQNVGYYYQNTVLLTQETFDFVQLDREISTLSKNVP